MDTPTPEDKYRHELLLSRTVLRNEMRKALHATTPEAKRALVRTWNQTYKPELAKELLRVAKNPEARYRIANWNLDNFDGERRVKKV